MWQFFQKETGKLSNRQNILTEKKINRQNKQKDKHDVARQRIWFFESPFHAGTTRFFSDRKNGNFIKKENLGIKQESGNQMQNKSRAILIKVNLSC